MIPIKSLKNNIFFLVFLKTDKENIMFFKNQDKSYTMTDLYLNHNIFFGYKDSYNYYDIDVDKILLFVKSDNEYIIRYNDVNKKKIVPEELKTNNFYFGELLMYPSSITEVPIYSVVTMKNFLENIEKHGIRLIN